MLEVHRELSSMAGTPCWSQRRVWGGRSGRENVWWTDHNPHSPSPCATGREEVEKIRNEVEPGKKGGVGQACF